MNYTFIELNSIRKIFYIANNILRFLIFIFINEIIFSKLLNSLFTYYNLTHQREYSPFDESFLK